MPEIGKGVPVLMQKVIYMEEAEQYAEYIAPKAGGYIREGRVDTYES